VEEGGGRVRREAAASLRTEGGRAVGVVTREGERIDAGAVVVAAGAWSPRIGGLPRELPVRPVRGQIFRLEPGSAPPRPLLADHGGMYAVPREDGTVLAGSTMEEAGFDDGVTEEGRRSVLAAVSELAPPLGDAGVAESWAGLRPVAGDDRPILGP
ncbi:MAG: NAD(P)/FAD-dependent oxidoreductase, partial [Gemmatimonadota bacterium]